MDDFYEGPYRCFTHQEGGCIGVIPRCPKCGRWIKTGNVFSNILGDVRFENWLCAQCGMVIPFWEMLPSEVVE